MSTPIPQNAARFTIAELLEATGGVLLHSTTDSLQAVGVSTDTRQELEGRLFVALRGERFDAHDYLGRAVAAKAVAIMAEDCEQTRALGRLEEPAVIVVDDSLVALGDLARLHRERWGKTLVGIVGSAGKTTTRSVCAALLNTIFPEQVHATRGNLNNRVGVPMTLFGLDEKHEVAVIEVGTNALGEVAELARVSRPDVGVLTLVDLEHTEGLGGLDGVEREEGALLEALPPGGVAIGYGDDERVRSCLERAGASRRLTYGESHQCDLVIEERRLAELGKSRLSLSFEGDTRTLVSPLSGKPGALAVCAGVLVCEALAPKRLEAGAATESLLGVGEPGRTTLVPIEDGPLVIDDSYNSNPASVRHGIETAEELAAHTGGRLWLVLGEMLELGELSEAAHREMGKVAARSSATALIAVQGEARLAAETAGQDGLKSEFFTDAAQVGPALAPRVRTGDVVLVKASRGVRAERVVSALRERP